MKSNSNSAHHNALLATGQVCRDREVSVATESLSLLSCAYHAQAALSVAVSWFCVHGLLTFFNTILPSSILFSRSREIDLGLGLQCFLNRSHICPALIICNIDIGSPHIEYNRYMWINIDCQIYGIKI